MVTWRACNLLKCSCSAQAGEQTHRIRPSPAQYGLLTCMERAGSFGHFKFDKRPKHKTWIHLSSVLKLNMCLFALLNRNQNWNHSGHQFVFSSALPAEVKTAWDTKKNNFVRCSLSKIQLQGLTGWEDAFIIATNDVPVLYVNSGLHVPMYQTSTF